jgi:hypothetical protein
MHFYCIFAIKNKFCGKISTIEAKNSTIFFAQKIETKILEIRMRLMDWLMIAYII